MEEKKNLTDTFLDTYHLLRRYHMDWYGKNFNGLDPRQGQGRILSTLRRMNNITQKELGFILHIRPQSLGELLQKLESNGYIKRYRSTDDKRALVIEITEKGKDFQVQKPNYDELFTNFNDTEKQALMSSLEKISAKLNELIQTEKVVDSY